MSKSILGLMMVLISLTLFFNPALAEQSSVDISPGQAKVLADSLLRLCEETAPIRSEVLSKRLELERLSARPWVSRKKLEKMQQKISGLDKELALKMKNFLDQASRMSATGVQQKGINQMGQGDRGMNDAR